MRYQAPLINRVRAKGLTSVLASASQLLAGAALLLSAHIAHADHHAEGEAKPQPAAATSAQAKAPRIPRSQWAFSNNLALRYNPLGLQNEFFVGYRSKLYRRPKNQLLFGKAYWWAGFMGRVSPQFALTSAFFRALPIAILELQGTFGYVTGLTSADKLPDYYTQGTLDAVAASASPRSSVGDIIRSGIQASLQARLQMKVGNIAVRSTNLFRYFDLNTAEGRLSDDLYYDQMLDVLTPLNSVVYSNDVDVLYTDKNKPWVAGARYTITMPLTEPSSEEVNADAIYDIQRAGLLFAWKFKAPPTAQGLEARRRHALIVLSQWHLDHRYRTGQSMNTLIPYFAVVYALNGRFGDD